jgi:zinc protease
MTASPQTEHFALGNGLLVVLHPDATASSAAIRVRYHVGAKDDPPGRAGMAHLVEHLTFGGSRRTAPLDFGQRLDALGAVAMNGVTSSDTTDYFETVPPSSLAGALWLEAERMAHTLETLDAAALAREREIVENERRQRCDAAPEGCVHSLVRRLVFGDAHPYGHPVIGRPKELDAISLEELRSFAGSFYRPNDAALVVSGAFDAARVRALVVELFGPIPPGVPIQRRQLARVRLREAKPVEVRLAVDAPLLVVAWTGPPPEGDGYEELGLALRCIEEQARWLVVNQYGLANDVRVAVKPGHLGSLITLTVRMKQGRAFAEVSSRLDEALKRSATVGRTFAWPEFDAVKLHHASSRLIAFGQPTAGAEQIADDVEYGGLRGLAKNLAYLESISAADLGTAIAQFLLEEPRLTLVVRPDASAPPPEAE